MKAQEQLGMRIKFLRKQRKWSQEDLALEANINKNYICDLENGRRNPSLDILERLCIAFKISLEEMFKGVETIPGI
ncbi:MAG: helix-turn-helix transcriptional regulator [Firmicutes bacterium]|nr:helix-turn-helix transcriptional regulator [Candidatus Fiminaster equi]